MVLWFDIDKSLIENVVLKDKSRFKYCGAPLRFQIPRGWCKWGVSAYKSFQVDLSNQDFINWWRDLESQLCPQTPFSTNLKGANLRLKIDEATYVFDQEKQVTPEVREGLFRGQELSILVDVEGTYFFNGNWGLICRASQVRFYGVSAAEESVAVEEPPPVVLEKGKCAFL
jgi:hypothetical protein